MRSFDPDSPADADVADPYYGDLSGFTRTRREIEAATPGLIATIRDILEDSSTR